MAFWLLRLLSVVRPMKQSPLAKQRSRRRAIRLGHPHGTKRCCLVRPHCGTSVGSYQGKPNEMPPPPQWKGLSWFRRRIAAASISLMITMWPSRAAQISAVSPELSRASTAAPLASRALRSRYDRTPPLGSGPCGHRCHGARERYPWPARPRRSRDDRCRPPRSARCCHHCPESQFCAFGEHGLHGRKVKVVEIPERFDGPTKNSDGSTLALRPSAR